MLDDRPATALLDRDLHRRRPRRGPNLANVRRHPPDPTDRLVPQIDNPRSRYQRKRSENPGILLNLCKSGQTVARRCRVGEGRAAGDRQGKILSPTAKRAAITMLTGTMQMSERFACKVVGLSRSVYRRLPLAQTPDDPDADLRAELRRYARKHPRHGFRRAWAWLRYDQGIEVNKKKIHRLWKEEGLQVRRAPRRKRAGLSSVPIVDADAPNVVWALDFQFDSTVDGKTVKIASMVDEHTRMSLLNIVDRSITADRLIEGLEKAFAMWGGPPLVLRMDNGPEFISEALRDFCAGSVGMSYIPPGTPWNNGFIESFNNRLRDECLNRNYWPTLLEARVVIEDFKDDHNHRHRHSALGYRTPAEYAAGCTHRHQPVACEID
ncbi:IS3 family transposase [Rhodococcus sp. RDE2]|uniref:IS3 family transposase n=1 Tax=Rhodococcus sp. RDE2 TaxID=2885078 RepID=UPI003B63CFBB